MRRYEGYEAALDELGVTLRWLHVFIAAHVHDALRATQGVRPLTGGLRLMRTVSEPWPCETNVSVARLLPPPPKLMYWGVAEGVCGQRRGAVVCRGDRRSCPVCHACAAPEDGKTVFGCPCTAMGVRLD